MSASGQWTRALGRHTIARRARNSIAPIRTVDEYRYALVSGINTRSGPFVVGGTGQKRRDVYAPGLRRQPIALTVSVGLRGDFWKTDPLLATDPEKDASFFSPRVRRRPIAPASVTFQAAVYRAHRTPTLNELYRGFRVGNTQTNPNSQLEPEKADRVRRRRALRARRCLGCASPAFANTLDGAIANFTHPDAGATILRERRNSDEIRATASKSKPTCGCTRRWRVNAQMTFTSSHYQGSVATPTLEGNRRATSAGGAIWDWA